MSLDLDALAAAVAAHGRVARVVVVAASGSTPRDAGTSMLVWGNGQAGTIGGGTLEHDATRAARDLLARGGARVSRLPLGPALGQCCGGAVTLATEVFDPPALDRLRGAARDGHALRPVVPGAAMPLSVRRLAADLRAGKAAPHIALVDGWLLEPLAAPRRPLWIFGAGHVGRALAGVIAPLPGWQITWVDTQADRFPDPMPDGVAPLVAADPARSVTHAPTDAHHLILTYSHALDLALCHALLGHGFASAGLIGSATKWARFRTRLRHLGHSDAAIARIACPIGDPTLGKHPQAIAVGVAARLLGATADSSTRLDMDRPA